MFVAIARATRPLVVAALTLALGGCIINGPQSYFSPPNFYGERFGQVEGSMGVDPCQATPIDTGVSVNCLFSLFAGLTIPSEFRVVGGSTVINYWLDPLILQVPSGLTGIQGSVAGSGSGTLSITTVTGPLPIDATRNLVPEPGTKFVVVDFPNGAPPAGAGNYAFTFNYTTPTGFTGPLRIKAMFAAKVLANGQTYYPPILPCVPSMAAVPSLTLPSASSFASVDLTPLAGQKGCNAVTYNMSPSAATPVTVVEYYNAALDHYFITWIASEIALLDAGTTIKGWARTGQTFKAYSTPQSGTSEVCRFYIPPAQGDSHFFGRGATECGDTRTKFPSFVLEDPQYMHVTLPMAGVCPAGTIAVYRVFSNRVDANHRYMTSRTLRDQMVTMGWIAEGDGADKVVMCVPA